jgi:anti-sigma-K factor RskA
MIDEDLHSQAALYALGALPEEEIATFRAQLSRVPGLPGLVAEYEEATATVAESAPSAEPSAALREQILSKVAKRPVATESRRIVWIPWALAAGFAFATGALWVENQRLTVENAGQRTAWLDVTRQLAKMNGDAAEKDLQVRQTNTQMAALAKSSAEKDQIADDLRKQIVELAKRNSMAETQVATLTSKLDGSYLASIAWDNSSQEGILHVRRLPEAAQGQNYQLWVIDPKNAAPVSAGVFTVQADGSATIKFSPAQKVSAATAFAVSVEKTGGSPAPKGPVVLSN